MEIEVVVRWPIVRWYVFPTMQGATARENPVAFQIATAARSALSCAGAEASDGRTDRHLGMRKRALMESESRMGRCRVRRRGVAYVGVSLVAQSLPR